MEVLYLSFKDFLVFPNLVLTVDISGALHATSPCLAPCELPAMQGDSGHCTGWDTVGACREAQRSQLVPTEGPAI